MCFFCFIHSEKCEKNELQNKEKCEHLECASSFITNLPLYLAEKTIELL